ncbi:MAG: hypothetical protein A4E67_00319 [Syntrophaceae bacterium PtaB.Bin038]|nr:MAG: hypothetical protein A4E67_00319 [Syntrophaceae bacterium PtaB.Bin038]
MAASAVSPEANAVSRITAVPGAVSFTPLSRSIPSMRGIFRSVMTRSNFFFRISSSAAAPSSAVETWYPSRESMISRTS